MKNGYKKQDSKGVKLKEVIGTGLDHEHYKKVKAARRQTANIRFMLTETEKKFFKDSCLAVEDMNESEILRMLVSGFVNGTIKIK
jgi:hypothetical protein